MQDLDLLEKALRRSVDWSVARKRNLPHENGNYEDSVEDKMESENYCRAFISHFKIELNKLMDAALDSDNHATKQNSAGEPLIRINGPDCAMYEINASSNKQAGRSASDEGYRSLSRNSLPTATSNKTCEKSANRRDPNTILLDEFVTLVSELRELKTRLLDLVEEFKFMVENGKDSAGTTSYNRRWRALVEMLDSMIDNAQVRVESHMRIISRKTTTTVSTQVKTNIGQHQESSDSMASLRSDSSSSSLSYEEQMQVFDYQSRGSSKSRFQISSTADTTATTTTSTAEQTPNKTSPTNEVSVSASKIPVLVRSTGASSLAQKQSTQQVPMVMRTMPIDFGAMMNNYEANKGNVQGGNDNANYESARLLDQQNQKISISLGPANRKLANNMSSNVNKSKHNPSYSSASSYSASSSSSFL